ncbi:MAG: ABC transporter ATP-binding protein/permease [Parvularculaceae bacterium]
MRLSADDGSRRPGEGFAAQLERDKAHRARVKTLRPLRHIWPYVLRYRGLLWTALFYLFVASATWLGMTGAGRLIIDCGFGDAAEHGHCRTFASIFGGSLGAYFVFAIVMAALMAITGALRYYYMSKLGERVVADIRRAVYDHIIRLSPAFFERLRTGEVLSRLTTDTTLVQTVVGTSASLALRTTVNMIGAIAIMLVVNWKLTVMTLGIVPFVIIPIALSGLRLRRLSRDSQDELAAASAYAGESLNNVQTVQAFTREDYDSAKFSDAVETTFKVSMRRVFVRTFMSAFMFTFALGGVVGVMWYGAAQVATGAMSSGALLQFVMLSVIAASSAGFLTEVWADLLRAAGASERLVELLAERSEIQDPEDPVKLPDKPRGAIRFDDVSFSYPTRPEDKALDGFSIDVKPAETVALVGPSGAGKSTVFQLLLRFYDPQRGSISFDGIDLRALATSDLRKHLAIVQQNAPLFSGSALENIRYGRPDATDEEVFAAARAAMAHDFIMRLPEGYDTDLGERAETLSGGQRQRIAIARAILRDASVLLLDEATSALDAESERAIQDAFERIAVNRTTLVIAHRLATVQKAHRIIVMDQGRVVDEGTHAELMKKGGLYARLAELQFNLEPATQTAAE